MGDGGFGTNGREGIGTNGGKETGTTAPDRSVSRRSTTTGRLDTMFDVLSNPRRRYLLYHAADVDEAVVELEAAVEAVAEYERDGSETVDRSTWDDVRIALHHDHLPRLASAGILDYDDRQGTIRLPADDGLEEWVAFARSKEGE